MRGGLGVCMLWVCLSFLFLSSSLSPKATECCYDNPSWSLLHRSSPQCRHSGNLLALGRQHKIGIIAVDYGTQWDAASERFIHPGKRDCVGGKKKRGVPWSLHSSPTVGTGMTSVAWKNGHSGHTHSPQFYPSTLACSNPPFFFLSRLCQFGCSAWPGKLGPLPLCACETKPLWRKREEAESFTWYQPRARMVASAYPFKGPSSAWKVLVWPPYPLLS